MEITETSKIEIITPLLADQLLRDDLAKPFQRPIHRPTVASYALEMVAGRWMTSTIEIVSSFPRYWIVNGRHRLSAVIESNTEQRFNIVNYQGDEDYARKIYGRFDVQKVRGLWDAVRGIEGKQTHLVQLSRAMRILVLNFETNRRDKFSNEFMLDMARDWQTEAEWFFGIEKSNHDVWEATPYLASAIYTYRHCKDLASVFWELAMTDAGAPLTPERKLFTFASETRGENAGGKARRKMLLGIAFLWNAAYKGSSVKNMNYASRVNFMGTPLEDKK